MPIRIGGFDQISSYVASGGTPSGVLAVNRSVRPSAAAFSLARSTARSLTSTAVTVAAPARAMARPITPKPQPRSSTRPADGGWVSRKSTAVPMSTRPWAKTPLPLTSSSSWPHTDACTGARLNATDGSAVK